MLLCHNICSSPTIEALWMCRIDELDMKDSPVEREHVSKQFTVHGKSFEGETFAVGIENEHSQENFHGSNFL